jgi:hypothetical protein
MLLAMEEVMATLKALLVSCLSRWLFPVCCGNKVSTRNGTIIQAFRSPDLFVVRSS